MIEIDHWRWHPSVKETETAQNEPESPEIGNRAPRHVFPISRIETAEREDPLSPSSPEFDRDEVLVCMALAFCLAGASTSIVYRLLG
jgi:hypothetical protein